MSLISGINFAQQAQIEGIKKLDFQGVEAIENVGFYTVYEEDKQSGKVRDFNLKFFDLDYNETNSKTIEMSKDADVSSSDNNATHLCIAFAEKKLKHISLKSFDNSGNLVGEINLSESAVPKADVYKAPNGFVVVNQIRKSVNSIRASYEIIGLDNKLKVLWKKDLNDSAIQGVIDVVATENSIAVVYTSGKGLKKENYDQHMMRLSASGDVVFDVVFASNYFYFPNKILLEGENTLIFGSFPEQGKAKTIGVFAISFDKSGNVLSKKEIEYKQEISPIIKDIIEEEDVNMKESPQFIVNDAIKTATGYFVITETIQLRPAPGVGANISTGGGSSMSIQMNTAFMMGDFLVLDLNSDLSLNDIRVITKKKNKVVFEGVVTNINTYYSQIKENDVSNYQFWIKKEDGFPAVVYTIRENFLSNIEVGVAALNNDSKVITSEVITSDLSKMKEVNGFGVMKNNLNKLSVFLFKQGVLSFYDLNF